MFGDGSGQLFFNDAEPILKFHFYKYFKQIPSYDGGIPNLYAVKNIQSEQVKITEYVTDSSLLQWYEKSRYHFAFLFQKF